MAAIRTSAPGKLFLLGEYAVLEGAPALLTAVDRRVRVSITPTDADGWLLDTPGLGVEPLRLKCGGALPEALDESTRVRLRLFDAVRRAVNTAAVETGQAVRQPSGLSISIDSRELSRDGYKLGLGSSAAVAVALSAALAHVQFLDLGRPALFAVALDAHREAQDGLGSGGDVAAAVNGGLISYSRGSTRAQAAPLVWPKDLTMMIVVTGDGSSTPELIGRVGDYARRDEAGYRADLARLSTLAERATVALGSADAFLGLAAEYFDALATLDAHAEAGIISDRHRQLHAVAARVGGVFKSSGAGGGDVGLAFARRGAPARDLAHALQGAQAHIVPLGFNAAGIEDSP